MVKYGVILQLWPDLERFWSSLTFAQGEYTAKLQQRVLKKI